ncbi:hypothetical protein B0H14DRAFT_3506998 [Mycena olivaceomarginata]|nr:hypothetical protein B0H14DRAFT_3506998 [Mycena olivaceomarginata]
MLATHNGLVMFKCNETQAFMEMWFTSEDHQYVMQAARNLDAKAKKVVDAADKEAKIQNQLDTTVLISSVKDIYQRGMTREKLQDQLEKLCQCWNTKTRERIVIPKKTHVPNLADKQRVLVHAFQAHLKLLEDKSPILPEPQDEDSTVHDHFHADNMDFGEFNDDTPIF